ncbi:DUF3152 domain-containing protein [Streptomyces sp. NPDC046821]|uniref:DUF3152 domain-containing protein n=1 Tax=Streptomyces sp. NPDC046821 TaxID=3154702 RepID=UPI0033C1E7CE
MTPPQGAPRATPPQGAPRGTPRRGVPQATPARGVPQATPPRGVPLATALHRSPEATPPHGFPQGTPAHGVPQVRGGHPEESEEFEGARGETRTGVGFAPAPGIPAPRQDYVDAFAPAGPTVDVYADVTDWDADAPETAEPTEPTESEAGGKRRKGRTYAGIAAAAVVTVLAVVVAGHVVQGRGTATDARARAAADAGGRPTTGSASRSDDRAVTPLTYDQKMAEAYPLSPALKASGEFTAVPGFDKAPGGGRKFRYRVDIENGLGLDGELFAQAVQKTLNDDRSWAHDGARTFERISSGEPDFVITLASPGTTGVWCAKSGLDTTEDNVSCDSASTERVMINAYRWAQGSTTYGDDKMHLYRQMLINHEVGHRLGYNHVTCTKSGELAPVMQQQTKFLTLDGITCKPNAWAFPES